MTNQCDVRRYRVAIEAELRERLLRDRTAAASGTAPAGESASTPIPSLAGVHLLCLQCQGLSAGDARFCTRCGTKFNAHVVTAAAADAVAQEKSA